MVLYRDGWSLAVRQAVLAALCPQESGVDCADHLGKLIGRRFVRACMRAHNLRRQGKDIFRLIRQNIPA